VVESLPEDLELKKDIFKRIDVLSEPDAILASNSSSYASSAFAYSVKNPARLLNTHFLMPPAVTPVELMSCGQTGPQRSAGGGGNRAAIRGASLLRAFQGRRLMPRIISLQYCARDRRI
jgi:hypothetical protein